jgi:hypothetical protein
MLDPRTLWLTRPEDRYEASPAMRRAERALYLLLRRPPPARPQLPSGGRMEVHLM